MESTASKDDWYFRLYRAAAFEWLCKRRRDYPANADVWSFRHRWPVEKQRVIEELRGGRLYFQPLQQVMLKSGERIDIWSARDALVLMAMTFVLADVVPVSSRCTHVNNHGGAKRALRLDYDNLDDNQFVLRSDVKSYYASIDHTVLLDQLAVYVKDRTMLNLLAQYLKRTVEYGGTFVTHERSISLGCPLTR